MRNKASGIYCIRNTRNDRVYFGSSTNLDVRRTTHFKRLKKGDHPNNYLQNDYNKHGKDVFEFGTLEMVEADKLFLVEQQYLSKYYDNQQQCYNIAKFVEATNRGRKASLETKLKMSKTRKGRKPTQEHRDALAKVLKGNQNGKGRKHTPETIAKMSASAKVRKRRIGWRNSDEFKKHLSNSIRGNKGGFRVATKEREHSYDKHVDLPPIPRIRRPKQKRRHSRHEEEYRYR